MKLLRFDSKNCLGQNTDLMRQTLSYAGGHLDRAGTLRKDPAWVADWLARPETLIVPVWRSRNLIQGLGDNLPFPTAITCLRDSASRIVDAASEIVFLGLDTDTAVFAADLSAYEETEVIDLVGGGEFVDLRRAGPLMKAREAALMAYARGILYWHQHHRYCSQCGHATESRHGGHMRLCTNPDCSRETFPRTDPAVIVLVEYRPSNGEPPKCLLGRHSRWTPGAYSTLAGFVEPGESLEEAVAREVCEEAGVRVGNVVYQASQPWPFPASVMLGFRAQAETTAITIDHDELEDVRWFTAEEIRKSGEWGDKAAQLCLPPKNSIACFLIESWLVEVHQEFGQLPVEK
jgi:NAD+ diphosphatase